MIINRHNTAAVSLFSFNKRKNFQSDLSSTCEHLLREPANNSCACRHAQHRLDQGHVPLLSLSNKSLVNHLQYERKAVGSNGVAGLSQLATKDEIDFLRRLRPIVPRPCHVNWEYYCVLPYCWQHVLKLVAGFL